MNKVKLLHRDALWDESSEAKSKLHFTPRRGPERIKFPMRAEKALRRLTNRPTLEKAKTAFLHYAVARYIDRMGCSKKLATAKATSELRHNMDGDWTLEFFKFHAEEYAKYLRPNFDAAPHEQRLSNFLSKVSAK
jgi:hypothetical protein